MGLFNNIFLLYCCVSITILLYNPYLIVGGNQTVLSWFDISINTTTHEAQFNSVSTYTNITDNSVNRMLSDGRDISSDSTSLGGFFLTLIDPVWQVIKVIGSLFSILFLPIIALTTISAPFAIILIIGVPFNFLGLLSLVMIIRGYG